MQQEVVPTSPKSPHSQAEKEKRMNQTIRTHLVFIVIVCSLVFGSLAGFFGFVIAANLPADLPFLGDLKAGLATQGGSTILFPDRKQTTPLLKQAPAVVDQIIPLYAHEPTIGDTTAFVGNAIVLTGDGWMVAPSQLIPDAEDDSEAFAAMKVVLPNGEMKSIQKAMRDELTGLTFFFINSVNLAVVNFQSDDPLSIGRLLSGVEKQMGSTAVYERHVVGEEQRSNSVRSTREFQDDIMVDTVGQSLPVGMPFFYNTGIFAGVLTEGGVLVQGALISSGLSTIVATGAVERSSLDVSYINIDRLTRTDREQRKLPENGLLITAVKEDADKTTHELPFLAGDVITHINNTFLDQESDLSQIIYAQSKGATFFFTIRRNDQEQVIEWKS